MTRTVGLLVVTVALVVAAPVVVAVDTDAGTCSSIARDPSTSGDLRVGCAGGDDDDAVEGEPDIRAFAPENVFAPGEERRLAVTLSNSGTVDDGGLNTSREAERLVTTARNVRVTLDDGGAPVDVRTDTVPLADLPSGSLADAGFDIAVDEDAAPGVYRLPLTVEYEYTESVSGDHRDDERETERLYVRIVVTENARFEVVSVDEDLQVGETGTVSVTLENVGDEDLRDATVRLSSPNADLRLGGGGDATRFVGDWDAGKRRTVEVEATAINGSAPHRYALRATVGFTDADGDPGESMPLPFGVRLADEQRFDLDDVDADLRVGADGTVTATITNDGPEPVADAVVRLVDGDGDVIAQRGSAVVGDLDAGADADISFPVTVPASAKPGDRRLGFVVSYVNRDGDPRTSDRLFGTVDVREERDRFTVEDLDAVVQGGAGTGSLDVTLENDGKEDLTDATVTVQSRNRDFLVGGAANATRYVGDWDAGDEESLTVELTSTNEFAGQDYPLTLVVSYTDEDGDQRRETILVRVRPDAEQRFSVHDIESTLRIGEEGRLNGSVVNRGPRAVSTAVLRLETDDAKLRPRETEYVLGDLSDGDDAHFSLPIAVRDTAQPGERRVTVVVEYVTREGDRRETDPISIVVDVDSETERFALQTVESDLQADDTGTVVLSLRNRRNETLTDATVSLETGSGGLVLADSDANETRFVGRWPPNATHEVRYRVRAGEETGNQTYALHATVAYEDDDGQRRRSGRLRFGTSPVEAQAFAVTTVRSSLRVGEEGRVDAQIENRAPRNVSAVGVELVTDDPNVNPVETAASVGDVPGDGAATFSLPIEIGESADPGTRQLSYRVHYTDDDGDRRTSDTVVADVDVAPERDPFVVERLELNVTAGESDVLILVVTNNRGVNLRDVRAKAFADDPLAVDDSEVFVPTLAPNESTVIRFSVSAADGAAPKTYPLSVDFLYTTPDGDDELSDPVNVGVTVEEPPPSVLPWWLFPALLVVAIVVVALVVLRRFRRRGGDDATEPTDDPANAASVTDDDGVGPPAPGGDGDSRDAAGGDERTDGGDPSLDEWRFGATVEHAFSNEHREADGPGDGR